MNEKEIKEIEDELLEQSHRIVFGLRGKRAVNPNRENARIMKR